MCKKISVLAKRVPDWYAGGGLEVEVLEMLSSVVKKRVISFINFMIMFFSNLSLRMHF